jgi:hypothetical protein
VKTQRSFRDRGAAEKCHFRDGLAVFVTIQKFSFKSSYLRYPTAPQSTGKSITHWRYKKQYYRARDFKCCLCIISIGNFTKDEDEERGSSSIVTG